MPFEIINFRTLFSIEVDYDTERNCNSYGCDGICRCGRLVNMEISEISVDYNDFEFSHKKGMKKAKDLSDVDKYCLTRLIALNGGYDKDNYEPIAVGGYYGEEVGESYFHNEDTLINDAQEMLNLKTDIEKVFFVLRKEYSFIAPLIADCTNVEIVQVKLCDVTASNGAIMLKAQDSYLYDFEGDKIKGILYGDDNLLIDGNHRYSFLVTEKGMNSKKHFSYISLS